MKFIRNVLEALVPVAVLGLAACATSDNTAVDSDALGIARFATVDSGNATTITGYDASGVEVGHVTIFHGTFTASPVFASDFSSPTVDGRMFDAKVGTQTYHWETEGYVPTMSLPTVDGTYAAMGTFLEEPQVVDVMKHWGIGFERFVASPATDTPSLDGEDPFALYCDDGMQVGIRTHVFSSWTGTGGLKYTTPVTQVTLPNNEVANTCGGSNVAATQLGIITTSAPSTLFPGTNVTQYMIVQECYLNNETRLYRKSCPAGTSTDSQCGTTTGQCKGCPVASDALGYEEDYPGNFGEGGHSETVDSFVVNATTTSMSGNVKVAYQCL